MSARLATADDVVAELRRVADPSRLAGMARVGIAVDRALGVSLPNVRRIARATGRDLAIAQELWDTGLHEARLVAGLVADPASLTMPRMRAWADEVDSWDLADLLAGTFAASRHADRMIATWAHAEHGFTKRIALAAIAWLAVHDAARPEDGFVAWFPLIRDAALDDRNEVTKAASWALRQIGKRDAALRDAAIGEATAILEDPAARGSRSARWVARDVVRELRSPAGTGRRET